MSKIIFGLYSSNFSVGREVFVYKGPDRLCLLWEIAACYFHVVIYSLLFLDNSLLCWKIVNFLLVILTNNRLFSDITGCYLKIASYIATEILRVIFKIVDSERSGPILAK